MRCGSPHKVRTRVAQYDLKGNKVKCPLKSNEDKRIFLRPLVWHSHKENGDAHVWHSQKDKGEETQGICVTFTQRRVGQFHSEKRGKGVTVQTK